MNLNSLGFSTPRALALGTVAVTLGLGVASGVFSTFYTTIQVGQTCSGYGPVAGYGYGYDCTPVAVVATGGGGGGGGSSSSSSATPVAGTPAVTPTVTPTVATSAIIAKDIAKSIYKTAIEILISNGVMNNVATVSPTRSITRAEFMKLISIANGYTPKVVTKKFGDLPTTNTLAPYVNFGVAMGWVNVKNTNFRPNDIITQGEIDKLISAIKKTATADTVARASSGVTRGKAASDIVVAFYTK